MPTLHNIPLPMALSGLEPIAPRNRSQPLRKRTKSSWREVGHIYCKSRWLSNTFYELVRTLTP